MVTQDLFLIFFLKNAPNYYVSGGDQSNHHCSAIWILHERE
jgi:hypothetical protein